MTERMLNTLNFNEKKNLSLLLLNEFRAIRAQGGQRGQQSICKQNETAKAEISLGICAV